MDTLNREAIGILPVFRSPPRKKTYCTFQSVIEICAALRFFQNFDPKVKLRGTPVGDKNQQSEFECPQNVQSDLI